MASALAAAAERARLLRRRVTSRWQPSSGVGRLTPDPRNSRVASRGRAAHVSWQLGRWQDSGRLFREAQRLGAAPTRERCCLVQLGGLRGGRCRPVSAPSGPLPEWPATCLPQARMAARRKRLRVGLGARLPGGTSTTTRDATRGAVAAKIVAPPDEPRRLCSLRFSRSDSQRARGHRAAEADLSHVVIGDSSGASVRSAWRRQQSGPDDSAVLPSCGQQPGAPCRGSFRSSRRHACVRGLGEPSPRALRPSDYRGGRSRTDGGRGRASAVRARGRWRWRSPSQRGDDDAAQDSLPRGSAPAVGSNSSPCHGRTRPKSHRTRRRKVLPTRTLASLHDSLIRPMLRFQPFLR